MTEEKTPSAGPSVDPPTEAPPEKNPGAPEPEAPAATGTESTVAEWESRFKYLLADFENYRKRSDRDRESVRLRAEADVLRNLLPIQDSFERAREFVRHAPHADPVRKGMELLAHEWDEFWKREGIEPVARVGTRFTADEHEVVGEAASTPGHPPGTVIEVVQQGYRFRGGLLRPAKVLVARTPSTAGLTATSPPAHLPNEQPSE
jgi:molecular chaperone GrpE